MSENGVRERPKDVAVIGAGMVGLSTAWFLQEHGCKVTLFEKTHVAAGASWGNAGWLTPALTVPLPDPTVLRFGLRALTDPTSPLYVPPRPDPHLLRFLAGFIRHSTHRRWDTAMRHLVPLNRRALEAFDRLREGGAEVATHEADPFLLSFRTTEERDSMLDELSRIRRAGLPVAFDLLDGADLGEAEPLLSSTATAGIRLHGQRYIDPPSFVDSLAAAVEQRDGRIRAPAHVVDIEDDGEHVALALSTGERERFDAVVIATGAWLNRLTRKFGVRLPVQAGRGYSFSVPVEHPAAGPIYFPTQRVACTPLGERLRVAGMMEFRQPDAALDPRRIAAISAAVRPLLQGVDLHERRDEWVGSRPVTPDGMPVIGPSDSRRVFVAGGHGMWGIVLGPLTGQLIADNVAFGERPSELAPFDPRR